MAKNIVICCDGTWNTPGDKDNGVFAPTNVVRLFNVVAPVDAAGQPQHKYYHPGVGTGASWFDKVRGGGTGDGLDRNIMSAYRELADHYEPGDSIFLFGFSRGAYTVRSLAGALGACGLLDTRGLPDGEAWARVKRVFEKGYRPARAQREKPETWTGFGWAFHDLPKVGGVRFLGVWDTVGALGIPDDMALLNLIDDPQKHAFHDTRLSALIRTARHAVALDEMRASFQPTLWTAQPGQDARQVWFPGVHADVGGGYRECGLSDGALRWMLDEAHAAGLVIDKDVAAQVEPRPLDMLHDPCDGIFGLLPTQPRSAPPLDAADVHESARKRQKTPPITQAPYRDVRGFAAGTKTATLDVFAAQAWNVTGLWLEAGREYAFSASGEWMDASITCGPAGTSDGDFQPAEVIHLVASAFGRAEEVFRKLTNNKSADFFGTRRHEEFDWMCLVGCIANGELGPDGKWIAHEVFEIGTGTVSTPKKSGYLYAYANDAWRFYGNNRGHVQMHVRAR
jgi:hypothetical protein